MANQHMTVLEKISAIKRMSSPDRGVPINKQAPFVWPDFRQGAPQWHLIDYGAYATEGFSVNQLVHAAIMYKVRSLYQLPLMAYTGNLQHPDPLPEENPLSLLCQRPNPHQSFIEFQGLCTVYLNVSGNCYIILLRDEDDKVNRMYPLRPDRVFIVPLKNTRLETDDRLIGFLYVKEGRSAWMGLSDAGRREALEKGDAIPILMEDMIHVKLPNPIDPLEGLGYGLSPLSPAAHPIDIDNKVTDFLKMFFDKGTMFQGLLSFDTPLDPNDIPAIRERWTEVYGGYENWNEVGILDQGGTYTRVTPTFQEMGFESIDGRNETRGVMPFGVPPILIGARVGLDRSTYSNYEQAREACWSDTLVPESRLFEVEYQNALNHDGLFVAYDYWAVPSLRKAIPELARAWVNLVQSGVPKNDATKVVKLPIPPIADGDVIYMPNQLIPVDDEGNPSRIYPGVQLLDGQPQPEQEEDNGKEGEKDDTGIIPLSVSRARVWSEIRGQFVRRLDSEGI